MSEGGVKREWLREREGGKGWREEEEEAHRRVPEPAQNDSQLLRGWRNHFQEEGEEVDVPETVDKPSQQVRGHMMIT